MYTLEQILDVMRKYQLNSGGFCEPKEVGHMLHNDVLGFVGQVNFAARKMAEIKRVSTRSSFCGSYGLKHEIEQSWTPADMEIPHGYVGNGAVIVAAYLLDIFVVPANRPNAYIGLSRIDSRKKLRRPK